MRAPDNEELRSVKDLVGAMGNRLGALCESEIREDAKTLFVYYDRIASWTLAHIGVTREGDTYDLERCCNSTGVVRIKAPPRETWLPQVELTARLARARDR